MSKSYNIISMAGAVLPLAGGGGGGGGGGVRLICIRWVL